MLFILRLGWYFPWSIQNRFYNLIAAKWLHIHKLEKSKETLKGIQSRRFVAAGTYKKCRFQNVLKNCGRMEETHSNCGTPNKYINSIFRSMHPKTLENCNSFRLWTMDGQRGSWCRQVFITNEPCSLNTSNFLFATQLCFVRSDFFFLCLQWKRNWHFLHDNISLHFHRIILINAAQRFFCVY